MNNTIPEYTIPPDMGYAVRGNSFGRIDKAGLALASDTGTIPRTEALDIVNNWRSCHSYPLQAIRGVLENRAKRISHKEPLIAQHQAIAIDHSQASRGRFDAPQSNARYRRLPCRARQG